MAELAELTNFIKFNTEDLFSARHHPSSKQAAWKTNAEVYREGAMDSINHKDDPYFTVPSVIPGTTAQAIRR